jgi:hypothetical protein
VENPPLALVCYLEREPLENDMLETKVDTPTDANPQETSEWLEALDGVVEEGGAERASYLL